MQGGEEEVARAVAGKEASGTVGPVGGGGEAEKYDAGLRISEAGYGPPPVGLFRESGPLFSGYFLAPLYEARAAVAGDYLPFEDCELFFSRRRNGSASGRCP